MKVHIVAVDILLLGVFLFTAAAFSSDKIRVRSDELSIPHGRAISVDGKAVGKSPCEFTVTPNVRHRIQATTAAGDVQTISFIGRSVSKSDEINDIPDWFLDPDLLRSQYPGYEILAAGTAVSRTVEVAMSKAELDATSRLVKGNTSLFSLPQSDGRDHRLDSTRSRRYPQLTRGQMDSATAASGGMTILTKSSDTVSRTVLQCEIQKSGAMYRVYVLVGKR